jgi:hypothetical protein
MFSWDIVVPRQEGSDVPFSQCVCNSDWSFRGDRLLLLGVQWRVYLCDHDFTIRRANLSTQTYLIAFRQVGVLESSG